jgi:hypothetical protein
MSCFDSADLRIDFLIIGAAKAGTTAGERNLSRHPDIFVGHEIHFFDMFWDRGLEWYAAE